MKSLPMPRGQDEEVSIRHLVGDRVTVEMALAA